MWGNGEEDQSLHPTSAFDDSLPPESFHTAAGYTGFDGVFHPNDIRIQAHIDRSETTSPANVEWVLQDTVPLEQTGPRGDRTWHGYATALFEVRTTGALPEVFEGTYSLRNRNGSPEGVIFVADAETGRMGVVFRLGQVEDHELDQSDPSNAPDNYQVAEMEINFGRRPGQPLPPGVASISGTQGVYISDEAFAAVSSLGFDSNQENHRLILVNGQLVYREHHATQVWMATNDAAPAEDLLPSGVSYCDCPAAKFGWWGGHIGLFGGGPGGTREDAVFPGTFVVGELPDIADIPSQGTATYSGHAAAAVRNAGVAYAAVGGFEMDWGLRHPHRRGKHHQSGRPRLYGLRPGGAAHERSRLCRHVHAGRWRCIRTHCRLLLHGRHRSGPRRGRPVYGRRDGLHGGRILRGYAIVGAR